MEFQQSLLDSLTEKGWAFSDQVLSSHDYKNLHKFALSKLMIQSFRPAQITSGLNTSIRSDSLLWLEPKSLDQVWIFELLETWRKSLTRELRVSAPHIEAHMTHYSAGQSYGLHCDQPQGSESRILTFVVYLHESWKPNDGGELSIYSGPNGHEIQRIEPRPGRVVFFKSREIWHEVRETHAHRISLTGWFRRP